MKRSSMLTSAWALSMLAWAGAAGAAPSTNLEKTLIGLEKDSWVAWQNHDGKFFQNFLSEDHVEIQSGGPAPKASVVAGVSGGACIVKSYKLDKFSMTQFTPSVALLTYWADQDTTCGTFHVPSPVWSSSLFVKRNGQWQNVLYQHTLIPTPQK